MTLKKMILSMRAAAMTAMTAVVTMTSLVPVEGWAQTATATPVCTLTAGGTTTEYFLEDDGGTYEDPKSAFQQAVGDIYGKASPTLKLFKNIDLVAGTAQFFGFSGTLTLDLNGCTVKGSAAVMDLQSGHEMTITDTSSGTPGQVVCTGSDVAIVNNGKLTISAGSFSKINNNSDANLTVNAATITGGSTAIENYGMLTVDGAIITATDDDGIAIKSSSNESMHIKGGIITANGKNGRAVQAEVPTAAFGNFFIEGGTFNAQGEGGIGISVFANSSNCDKSFIIQGCTIEGDDTGAYGIDIGNEGSDGAVWVGNVFVNGFTGAGILAQGNFAIIAWPSSYTSNIAFVDGHYATFGEDFGTPGTPPDHFITVQAMTFNSQTNAYDIVEDMTVPIMFIDNYGDHMKYTNGDDAGKVIPLDLVFRPFNKGQEIVLREDESHGAFMPTDLAKYTVDAIADYIYDGTAHEPTPDVYINDGTKNYYITDDLTFAYANNTNAYHDSYPVTKVGRDAPTVTATNEGSRHFTGSVSKTFQIAPKVAEFAWSNTALTYNGSAQLPTATVSNICGDDACSVTVSVTGGDRPVVNSETNEMEARYSGNYTVAATTLGNTNYRMGVDGVTEEAAAFASLTSNFTISPAPAKITPYLAWDEDAGALAMTSHDAIVLEGWETTIGTAGEETWYLASGTLNYDASNGGNDDARLTTNGDVHLILADGATMNVNGNNCGIESLKDDNQTAHKGHLYIHSQGGTADTAEGTLSVSTDGAKAISAWGDLTIDGGIITATATGSGICWGIIATGDITITGGQTTATSTSNDQSYAIYAGNRIIVTGGKLTATATSGNSKESNGIFAYDAIRISNATVSASGTCNGSGYSYGINTYTRLTIDKSTVEATGKTNGSERSYGINATIAITLNEANVTASGTNDGDGPSYGISSSTLTIDKGIVKATAKTSGTMQSIGIHAGEEITINDADVTASGTCKGDEFSFSFGIKTNSTLSITGGTITANGLNDDNNNYYTAGIKASTITLDWSDASDFILASSYDGTVKIPAGRYFATLKDDGTVGQIYGNAATDGDYIFDATAMNAIAGKTLHPVAMIPSSGGQYIGYSEQGGDMAIIGGTAQSYAVVGYDFSTSPAVVYVTPVTGLMKGCGVVLGPASGETYLPDEVGIIIQTGSTAEAIEKSFTSASPLRNFIAAPADGTTTLDQQIAQTLGTGTPGQPDYVEADPSDYIVFMIIGGQFRPVNRTAASVLPVNTAVLAVSKMDILRGGTVGTKPAAARRIILGDGEANGIVSLPAESDNNTDDWYTLDGRRLDSRPTAKGVYIHKGEKVVVR